MSASPATALRTLLRLLAAEAVAAVLGWLIRPYRSLSLSAAARSEPPSSPGGDAVRPASPPPAPSAAAATPVPPKRPVPANRATPLSEEEILLECIRQLAAQDRGMDPRALAEGIINKHGFSGPDAQAIKAATKRKCSRYHDATKRGKLREPWMTRIGAVWSVTAAGRRHVASLPPSAPGDA